MKSWDNFEQLGVDMTVSSTKLREPGMKTSFPLNQFPDMSTLRFQTLSEDTPTAVAKLMAYEISPPMTNWKFRDVREKWFAQPAKTMVTESLETNSSMDLRGCMI